MNKIAYLVWRNEWLQKLDFTSRRHINCIKFGDNESRRHIEKKVKYILDRKLKKDIMFLTEIISRDREHRADILILDRDRIIPEIIEVQVNENGESLNKKREYWEKMGFDFQVI